MDSSPPTRLPRMADAPDPRDDAGLIRTFQGYRAALATMTVDQLMERLTDINMKLEAESQANLTRLISSPLSTSIESLDRLQMRSLRTAAPPSRPDRGQVASQPSPVPRQQSAAERLAASRRMAPRLAAKLVASEVRKARRERDG